MSANATVDLPYSSHYDQIGIYVDFESFSNISESFMKIQRTSAEDSIKDFLSILSENQYYYPRYRQIQDMFVAENEKYSKYISVSPNTYNKISQYIICQIARIPFSKVAVEFSPMDTITIKVILEDNIKIEFTHYLNEEGINPNFSFFGVFENRKLISSGQASLPTFVEDIKESFNRL
jgi:hypothetical protein